MLSGLTARRKEEREFFLTGGQFLPLTNNEAKEENTVFEVKVTEDSLKISIGPEIKYRKPG